MTRVTAQCAERGSFFPTNLNESLRQQNSLAVVLLLTRQVLPLEGARLLGSRVADRDRSDSRWAHC
jgi:hypothetical protein